MQPIQSVSWSPDGEALRILDQRELPAREVVRDLVGVDEIADAIRTLAIRGAPAIGVGAAIGLAAAIARASHGDGGTARRLLPGFAAQLAGTRPTAVNLSWAMNRMLACAHSTGDDRLLDALRAEATAIADEDAVMCRRIGEHGVSLLSDGMRVLTHCNAGALATSGIGTALAPVYVALERGMHVHVYASETRPLRQGARLTAWELARAGVQVTIIPDSAAAALMSAGEVELVIVGADRIARNGDTANKIGTYAHAISAQRHGIPFHVAAPWSTIDAGTPDGRGIVVEHRAADELGEVPAGAAVWNPAFDVTPVSLVTSFITDRGIHEARGAAGPELFTS
jgi:methylthioribose-1-phosphate isomerase